jgi:hypothetical protein
MAMELVGREHRHPRDLLGGKHLATLVIAIERHAILVAEKNLDHPEVPEPVTV